VILAGGIAGCVKRSEVLHRFLWMIIIQSIAPMSTFVDASASERSIPGRQRERLMQCYYEEFLWFLNLSLSPEGGWNFGGKLRR
jgi:hypothetical protein